MRNIIEEYLATALVLIATFIFIGTMPAFAERISTTSDNVVNTHKIVVSKDYYENTAIDKPMRSLSIDGVIYDYEEGMSWNEWLNSSYNTANFTILIHPCSFEEYIGRYNIELIN